jgi:hypothetical protein
MDACRLGAHAARWVEKKAGLLRTPLVQAPGYCAAWSSTVEATAWCPSWITGAAAERRRRSNAQTHTRLCSVTVPWSGMHVVACYPDRHTGSARWRSPNPIRLSPHAVHGGPRQLSPACFAVVSSSEYPFFFAYVYIYIQIGCSFRSRRHDKPTDTTPHNARWAYKLLPIKSDANNEQIKLSRRKCRNSVLWLLTALAASPI